MVVKFHRYYLANGVEAGLPKTFLLYMEISIIVVISTLPSHVAFPSEILP
jgi:hypothetical protein